MEYDIVNDVWKEHSRVIIEMQRDVTERIFEDVGSYFVSGQYIWMTNMYSNRVTCFDMESAKYKCYEIGDRECRYSAIAVKDEKLYLSNAYTGEIQVWTYRDNKLVDLYKMPQEFRVLSNALGRRIAHRKLWLVNNQLYAVPNVSNMLVKINLVTQEVSIVAKEFWEDVLEPANYYHPKKNMTVNFSQMIDESTLLVQKRRDASLLEIDIYTGKYQIHYPRIAGRELEKMLANKHGFEKLYINGEFACREGKYFSVQEFLDDLVNDRLDNVIIQQKEEMQTMVVNLDGTCGEMVCGFIKELYNEI